MKTGTVEANLGVLNEDFRLPHVSDLIALKMANEEQSTLDAAAIDFHTSQCQRLLAELELAAANSELREEPIARHDLNDLLIRLRLQGL